MQKLEKSLISIKNFFNKLEFYFSKALPSIFWLTIFVICWFYYEDFFKFLFSRSVPITSLYEYTQNQPIFWKTTINRMMFSREKMANRTLVLNWEFDDIYRNRSRDPELVRWNSYDFWHFADTQFWVFNKYYDGIIIWSPHGWNKRQRNYTERYRRAVMCVWRFAQHDVDRVWPRAYGDELELLLRFKWPHNIIDVPISRFLKFCANPLINFFVEPTFRFFLVVNFKRDFLYYLPKGEYGSLFLISTVKFIFNTIFFFNSTLYTFFTSDIQYFLNELFYKISKPFHTYIIFCDFLHCNWANIFFNLSIEDTLSSLKFYLNYSLCIFSFLIFKFYFFLGFTSLLNPGFELIFLENFFFIFFSYFFAAILSYTIFNKFFWTVFGSFLNWIFYICTDIVYVFFIIFCIKIVGIFTFLPFQLWKYLLKKYLTKDAILKIVAFLRRNYSRYLWYKELAIDIRSGEYWLRKS